MASEEFSQNNINTTFLSKHQAVVFLFVFYKPISLVEIGGKDTGTAV